MGLRSGLLVALCAVAWSAEGAVPMRGARPAAETLTAMPALQLSKPLRAHRGFRFEQRALPAWHRFVTAAGGGRWRAAWDPATGVPNRIWGPGVTVAGANASPAIAERAARQWLADHLALLAPGATVDDFVLVSNHDDGDQRSVGFLQRRGTLRVVGGQVSFRFKRDRLFVIGSEALPNVAVAPVARVFDRDAVIARGTGALRTMLALPAAPVRAPRSRALAIAGAADPNGEVILPLIADDAVLAYRVALPVEIDGGAEGRYLAYLDASSGEPLAIEQQNFYASGTLLYRVTDRHPGRARVDREAARAHVAVGAVPQTSGPDGRVNWTPDVNQVVDTAVVGDLVTIVNKIGAGDLATVQLPIAPGGAAIWDESANADRDAQLVTYVAVNRVKDYVRTHLDPLMPKLDEPIVANVNIGQQCNAFFDGSTINFFQASQMCQNSGLLEDVIYHEFGHNIHQQEIIEGVGSFEGGMSEGAADFMAALITRDSGMGRGFFYTDDPLRELNPPDTEASYPRDVGEVHKTGLIFGGLFWDLWQSLITDLGEANGTALVDKLFVATLRRSVSIPSSLIEALAADDDDGNLDNGTPHECLIRAAYGRHGLRTATGGLSVPEILDENASSTTVRADLEGLSERCQGDEVATVKLEWRPAFTQEPAAGKVDMTAISATRFWAPLPLARDGLVYYRAIVTFVDGSELSLPDNFADRFYSAYQGSVVKLYCNDFEAVNPLTDGGWAGSLADGGASPWEWGAPSGAGATDPPFAFSGTKVLAQNLGGDYAPNQHAILKMPPIDVGQYSDVRLQYRRWLAVEDSEFDKATVLVNGKQAWVNFTANEGQRSTVHHIDREWRFHDVPVSGWGYGHIANIEFQLASDQGLELGGWALDDVCVVANRNSICGDGVKTIFEQCDDGPGNADLPGACRTYCKLPTCGDFIQDEGEACDEGETGTTTCTSRCQLIIAEDTGCCSTGDGPQGPLVLTALVGFGIARRRRRRA